MLTIAIFKLALVVGQVACHPPPFTLNDDDVELPFGQLPFEMTNPSSVNGKELYESDIMLTDEQRDAIRERKAVSYTSSRWTESGGFPFVPYVFMDSVDQTSITDAIDHWEKHTCITFAETSNTNQPHLQFLIENGCWSYIGMISSWNGQEISIGSGCNGLGTVVHEIGHAIGFYHEQSRSDRDDHVIILTENIISGRENNFDKHVDNNFSVTYDYSSNMHYGTTYFSENGKPTIVTLDPMSQELIGSRNGLTHRDILLANRMYGCIDKWIDACPGVTSDNCLNGGYIQKDCTCACPPGTSGSTCETVTGDYYEALQTRSEKITTEGTITVKSPFSGGETFAKWIVPPTCKSAKVVFTFSDLHTQCAAQFITVRTVFSDYAGQTLCHADVNGGATFTSDTEIIITTFNSVNYGTWETTVWTADVTFEDIVGSGCTTVTGATTQPPTTTANPTTTAPTNPPTTTTNPLSTTEAPPPKLRCTRRPRKKTLSRGAAFTLTSPGYPNSYSRQKIRCGWKLKAKWPAKLLLTCDAFQLRGRDLFKVNRQSFKLEDSPPQIVAKWLGITFMSRKRSSAPGFSCVVKAI